MKIRRSVVLICLALQVLFGCLAPADNKAEDSKSYSGVNQSPRATGLFNVVAVYKENEIVKFSTDLGILKEPSLNGKKGFLVIERNLGAGGKEFHSVPMRTALFSPKIEEIDGVPLTKILEPPRRDLDAFWQKVKAAGIPVGQDTYAFNLSGVAADVIFHMDGEQIARGEIVKVYTDRRIFNKQYETSRGEPLKPETYTFEDLRLFAK
jgi:hypothetical protein